MNVHEIFSFHSYKSIYILSIQVQTDLAYVTKHREELLAAMDAEQQRERLELSHKLTEKVKKGKRIYNK